MSNASEQVTKGSELTLTEFLLARITEDQVDAHDDIPSAMAAAAPTERSRFR